MEVIHTLISISPKYRDCSMIQLFILPHRVTCKIIKLLLFIFTANRRHRPSLSTITMHHASCTMHHPSLRYSTTTTTTYHHHPKPLLLPSTIIDYPHLHHYWLSPLITHIFINYYHPTPSTPPPNHSQLPTHPPQLPPLTTTFTIINHSRYYSPF